MPRWEECKGPSAAEQMPCEGARKCGLRFVDHRRRGTEDGIGVERVDNVEDGVSMDLFKCPFVFVLRKNVVSEERRDDVTVFCEEGLFHATRPGI